MSLKRFFAIGTIKYRNILRDLLRIIMSLNLAILWRILRFGSRGFLNITRRAFYAVNPFESKKSFSTSRPLNSIPVAPLEDIMGCKKASIEVIVGRYEDGMLAYKEAISLIAILIIESPKEVLEIGTFFGHTTKLMAENLSDAIIHTVDLPEDYSIENDTTKGLVKDDHDLIRKRVVGREFKGCPCEKRIGQYGVDTASWDFQLDGKPTFFFIDGSHTYEYCKNDSDKCFKLCGGKGTFVWHDCDNTHAGIVRLICEWRSLGRNIVRIGGSSLAYFKSV